MALDLAAVRAALCAAVTAADDTINCYPYPEPQPEYPALRLPTISALATHATTEGGSMIEWVAELIVADPGTEDATQRLEALLPIVLDALDNCATAPDVPAIVNVSVRGAGNFRDQQDSLLCDVLINVHV